MKVRLIDAVEVDFIKDDLLAEYPQLAASF
jgi:hypothetical protein